MIFVTLGSQKFQFNRLLKSLDQLVYEGKITDRVFAQIGYSDYLPKHFEYEQFMDRDKFAQMQDLSDIIITHAGTGAIVGALKKGKKVIAVPRLAKYGEHVDDHQLQIVNEFEKSGLILTCEDCGKLDEAIELVKNTKFNVYQSNTAKFIDSIESFIEEL